MGAKLFFRVFFCFPLGAQLSFTTPAISPLFFSLASFYFARTQCSVGKEGGKEMGGVRT